MPPHVFKQYKVKHVEGDQGDGGAAGADDQSGVEEQKEGEGAGYQQGEGDQQGEDSSDQQDGGPDAGGGDGVIPGGDTDIEDAEMVSLCVVLRVLYFTCTCSSPTSCFPWKRVHAL